MARAKQPKQIMQMSFAQWEKAFPDEDACDAFLVANRWPKGVFCPRCGSKRVYPLTTRKWHWECPDCRQGGAYRFSDITGTIFENTKIDLRQWFRVIHLMLTSKKGMSARQVQRFMGFGSYKTAWFVCHRIRIALVERDFQRLMGIVEIDETLIGGKAKNRHGGKDGGDGHGGTGPHGKSVVVGAVARKGNIVARVVARADGDTLRRFINEAISTKVSILASDDYRAYRHMDNGYNHQIVRHTKGEYVCGAIHTNTIEGFWSILKRGVVGTFHKVSPKYLPLYVAEFAFRYNHRMNENIFDAAIAGC